MSNPLCECPVAGYCTRHKMHKNETFHALCHGDRGQAGWKYFVAWESGKLGATSPQNANSNPPVFEDSGTGVAVGCSGCGGPSVQMPSIGSRVMTAIQAAAEFVGDGMQTASETELANRQSICGGCPLNESGTCNGCGCIVSLKVQGRLSECPASKWFPELHQSRPIVDPIRNLIMHILPVAGNDNWKWNLDQVATRQHLFDGKRVLAIASETAEKTGGKILTTVTPDEVIEYSKSIGLDWTHIQAFKNNSRLREVATFPWLLEQVESTNSNEVTFACHAKGVTHSADSITMRWAEKQYHVCLDDWQTVCRALGQYSMAGSFRRFGQFTTPGNNRWHYSGTNYWFRHDDVFTRDWRKLDKQFFGTESWPAHLFKAGEVACLFGDNVGDLYREETWQTMERETQVWEGARL